MDKGDVMPGRTIIHVDMDAFYAAIEIRDNPSLKGKPVIIGALPHQRGVVSTCSYEARKFGIRSAMNIKDAYQRCPDGVYLRPSFEKYEAVSSQIRKILLEFTDIAEFVALDEGYLDITYTSHLFGGPEQIAWEIKKRIKNELQLTCSVGIGYNMMTAKLASEEKKPDGFYKIMNPEDLDALILGRPVSVIYGVGKKTREILEKYGIFTVKDLRQLDVSFLKSLLGSHGIDIYNMCRGIDHREVTPNEEAKSYGRETTYQENTNDFNFIRNTLKEIVKELALLLKQEKKWCRTVTLKIKFSDMNSITRSQTVEEPINDTNTIYNIACKLLDKVERNRYIRLVGLSLSNLTNQSFQQISFDMLDNAPVKKDRLSNTLFQLKKKHGMNVIRDPIDFSNKR